MSKNKRLQDEYRFPGFYPKAIVKGVFEDHKARVIELKRRQKKRYAAVAEWCAALFTIAKEGLFGICRVEKQPFIWKWRFGEFYALGAGK